MVSNSKFILLAILLSSSFLISSCGGGGGGGGASSGSVASLVRPSYSSDTDLSINSNLGSYSSDNHQQSAYGIFAEDMPSKTHTYGDQMSSANISDILTIPANHLEDTGAITAWSQGWTGQDTSIHVIDDHNYEYIELDLGSIDVSRSHTSSFYGTVSNWDINYDVMGTVSHGWLVSGIAGGDVGNESISIDFIRNTKSRTSCDGSNGCNISYDSWFWDFQKASAVTNIVDFDTQITMPAGVAKDASITNSQIDLSGGSSLSQQWNDLVGHLQNSASYDSVVLSLGIPNSSYSSFNEAASDHSSNGITNTKSVFAIAAGNSGAPCTNNNFLNCNLVAVDLALDSTTKDQLIVVGALNSTGTSIATYSNRAGVLKDRFLLASGETGFQKTDGDYVVGTSFAAPRVAGAAALLKSKFQNLTGAQAADILLLTADKDINDDGSDDFSGVSDIYGHGELDTGAALSPIGNLYSY